MGSMLISCKSGIKKGVSCEDVDASETEGSMYFLMIGFGVKVRLIIC